MPLGTQQKQSQPRPVQIQCTEIVTNWFLQHCGIQLYTITMYQNFGLISLAKSICCPSLDPMDSGSSRDCGKGQQHPAHVTGNKSSHHSLAISTQSPACARPSCCRLTPVLYPWNCGGRDCCRQYSTCQQLWHKTRTKNPTSVSCLV